MQISLAWLNTYLDQPTDAQEAETLLTAQGFPIEGCEACGADDLVLDVEVTSNRPDCLSHVGVAREIAAGRAAGDDDKDTQMLRLPEFDLDGLCCEESATSEKVSVECVEPELCDVYTARVITGVKVGASPSWLIERLEAIGLRTVNNIVDITNFVLHETGQPLHTFDLDRMSGQRVIVRHAKEDEAFDAIDGSSHRLSSEMLVIADATKAQAIAGVMGGRDSQVSDETVNVLLESASFAPLSVRKTSRRLKLSSDSSFRFERGVDRLGILKASARAAKLIIELAGGVIAKEPLVLGDVSYDAPEVELGVSRCNQLLGTGLSGKSIERLLTPLELSPRLNTAGDALVCTIPSHRLDLPREIDLIEEVVRLYGLDRIATRDKIALEIKPVEKTLTAKRKISQGLVAHGYFEAINHSLITQQAGEVFVSTGHRGVFLQEDKFQPMLRPSILPSLLHCRKMNQDVGNEGIRLFEIASVWEQAQEELVECVKLGFICDYTDDQAIRKATGAIADVVTSLAGNRANIQIQSVASDAIYRVAGRVMLDHIELGHIGVLTDAVTEQFGVQNKIIGCELDYAKLIDLYSSQRTLEQLSRFPDICRDLSVVVNESVSWSQIKQVIDQTSPALLVSLDFVGVYRGKPIAKGRKSLSLRMVFNDAKATLRHEQVDAPVSAIITALREKFDATLRD